MNPSGQRRADMSAEEVAARNPDRPATVPLIDIPELDDAKERKAIKRISSPERWEYKQMMAANVVDVSELPDFDEETGLLPKEEENSGEKVIIVEVCSTDLFDICIAWY